MYFKFSRMAGGLTRSVKSVSFSLLLCAAMAHAAVYYVATTGNDNAGGSFGAPYKTIQKAASVVQAGDSCYIRGGVYRESFTAANSGTALQRIVFIAYQNETVTVSGADTISGWSVSSGNIYKAPMGWDLGTGQNQVFVNGQMMLQARYPNSGFDMMRPKFLTVSITSKTSMSCSALNQATNYWNGGFVWACYSPAWTAQTATITASTSSGQLTLSGASSPWFPVDAGENGNNKHGAYITGLLKLLDTASEWHYETSNLYFWAPNSVNPASLVVEAKHRQTVATISGSYVTLKNLNFFCGKFSLSGINSIVDSCTGKYIQHYTISSGYGGGTGNSISGSENQIINSEFAFSAGNAFNLSGTHNIIRNCLIHDVAYNGNYASCISMGGTRCVVDHNTMYNSGRWILGTNGKADTISYNDMYDYGFLTDDLGATYAYGNDGGFTRMCYNWVHDNKSWFANCGFYVDDGARNFVIDHNVIWKQAYCIYVKGFVKAYNNTCFNWVSTNATNGGLHQTLSSGATAPDIKNALNMQTNPQLQLADYQNFDFQLKSGAAAINAGTVISGFTDGYVGSAPDLGAYEFGAPRWTAGRIGSRPTPVVKPINSSSVVNPVKSAIKSYAIFSVNGKCVRNWSAVGPKPFQKIELPGFGVYIVKFKTANSIQAIHVMALNSTSVILNNSVNN